MIVPMMGDELIVAGSRFSPQKDCHLVHGNFHMNTVHREVETSSPVERMPLG